MQPAVVGLAYQTLYHRSSGGVRLIRKSVKRFDLPVRKPGGELYNRSGAYPTCFPDFIPTPPLSPSQET